MLRRLASHSSYWSMGLSFVLHGLFLFGLGAWAFQPPDFSVESGEGGIAGFDPDREMQVVVELEERPREQLLEPEEIEMPVEPEPEIPEPLEIEESPVVAEQPLPKPKPPVVVAPKPAPRPQPQPQQATGSGGVQIQAKPDYLRNPDPPYPLKAKRLKQQGLVKLDVWVKANGRVDRISLRKSSGHRLLDDAAIRSVKRWRFKPARLNGVKVAAKVVVPVRFELK